MKMKNFRFLAMLLLGVLLNVNLISCSKDDNLPEKGDDKVEHPNGIPNKIPNNVIYYTTKDKIIVRLKNEDVFGGAKIVSNTYSSTKGYGTIEFASEVTAIESKAFMKQSTLTYIAFSNSVTSIGDEAFRECSALTSVSIPKSVTSIGHSAFRECSGLTSVTIPNSVESIGEGAFYNCYDLTSVQISDITAWCNIDFGSSISNPLYYAHHLYMNGKEVKDLVIPKSVKSIGDYAFSGCSGLTSVTIPNSVTSIGSSAFERCSGLTSVTIGNSVTSIGYKTFASCSGLTSVTIPNSVTSIGEAAFSNCSGLTSVTIGNSVTSIGDNAFYYCSGLTSVTIGNSVKGIGYYAFSGCSKLLDVYCYAEEVPIARHSSFGTYIKNSTLHVPASSFESYKADYYWREFGKIVALTK